MVSIVNEALREASNEDSRGREQSEAPSSPTMVGSELPKSKSNADPEKPQPHVAFAGLNDTPDKDTHSHHPIKSDAPPKVSEPNSDEAAIEGPADPSKRAVPPTVLFTENGGIREGPAEGKIPDEVPTIVASSNASHAGADGATSTSTGLKEDGTQAQTQTLSTPRMKEMVAESEKPRLSGESDIRPEGTGTKRMFQLSKRFSMCPLTLLSLLSPNLTSLLVLEMDQELMMNRCRCAFRGMGYRRGFRRIGQFPSACRSCSP